MEVIVRGYRTEMLTEPRSTIIRKQASQPKPIWDTTPKWELALNWDPPSPTTDTHHENIQSMQRGQEKQECVSNLKQNKN